MTMHQPTRTRRGFSLIELLVTIAVIAIVIAILVPTLSGARNTARAAGSQAQLTEIGQASSQYFSDNQRLPGYFTPRQMGSSDNEGRGFSGMQNIMLDLAGGIVEGPAEGNVIEVGPDDDNTVFVDLTFIGTTEAGGGYYTPRDTSFVAQNDPDVGLQETDGDEEARRLPSVLDSFNTPILAWQRDRTAIQPIEELADFVQDESGGDVPARFYWASNAGFLKTTDLGKRGKDPTFSTSAASREFSLIGEGVNEDPELLNHLAVLLGSPSVPNPGDNADALQAPSAARGDLILHSAGIDAMYMSSKDIGGGGDLRFWQSFFVDPPTGSSDERIQDGSGQVESIDLLDRFDDLIETVGN
ncbi:MAG: type II secretion system protein [Phycisphaerales bacterium]